ncbi:MAG: hypothetical protein GY862_09180 [Gammaproteobacteria bacterium]|nr:hypothetical protein [Gammaproteobacteria bacterium]
MRSDYKITPQQLVHISGMLLAGISFYYIFNRLQANYAELALWRPAPGSLWLIGFCIVGYGFNGFLLSAAWRQLLVLCGYSGACFGQCHIIYGYTQIAKYIPGNIFHFTGRYIMGRQAGMGHLALIGSSLYEVLGVLFAAAALAISGILFYDIHQPGISPLKIFTVFCAIMVLVLIISTAIPKLAKLRNVDLPVTGISRIVFRLLPIYALYMIFFCIAGVILNAVVFAVAGLIDLKQGWFIIAVFSIAWLAGFITPGASAGIGIRETVLVLFLTPLVGEAASLAIAFISRIVTVGGDAFFFLISYFLRDESIKNNNRE